MSLQCLSSPQGAGVNVSDIFNVRNDNVRLYDFGWFCHNAEPIIIHCDYCQLRKSQTGHVRDFCVTAIVFSCVVKFLQFHYENMPI